MTNSSYLAVGRTSWSWISPDKARIVLLRNAIFFFFFFGGGLGTIKQYKESMTHVYVSPDILLSTHC